MSDKQLEKEHYMDNKKYVVPEDDINLMILKEF
jgi:hypothetical protein